MPLQARRPNLPALALPGKTSRLLVEDVRTPIPFTPVPFEQGPLVMTPDTPAFELSCFDMGRGKKSYEQSGAEDNWTEDEDGLLQSYLAHPPRALSTSYPPGTLPPSAALDEIASQIITLETRRLTTASEFDNATWRHSWSTTRQRLFTIARKESMEATGGHRRQKSDSIVPSSLPAADATMKPQRPRLAVLGGSKMDRRQHSMDSLYGDEEPHAFQETLRLSSNLQDSADGANSILSSGSGLSSPLTFSFNMPPTPSRKPFPFSAPSTHFPRPASLLQRGRSFTSEDFAREHGMSKIEPDDFVLDGDSDDDDVPTITVRGEMQRSVSSPDSLLHSSPPSSVSSKSGNDSELDVDVDMDIESAPITPMEQTFGAALGYTGLLGDQCLTPTPRATPAVPPPAPSIMLTVDSPEQPTSTTPRIGSANSPSNAFASLSLSGTSLPLALPFTSAPMTTSTSVGTGAKRALRPTPLHRSLSESSALSLSPTSKDRETKRQRPAGLALTPKYRPGLVVSVPKRTLLNSDELKSPFEFKGSAL